MAAITKSADSSAYRASNKGRRASSWHVREARDRLTSSSGTRPAFDYELLRLFAQNRLSASLVILLLVGTVGLLSSVWTGALRAGTWTSAVLMIHAITVTKSRQFGFRVTCDQHRRMAPAVYPPRSFFWNVMDVYPHSPARG